MNNGFKDVLKSIGLGLLVILSILLIFCTMAFLMCFIVTRTILIVIFVVIIILVIAYSIGEEFKDGGLF